MYIDHQWSWFFFLEPRTSQRAKTEARLCNTSSKPRHPSKKTKEQIQKKTKIYPTTVGVVSYLFGFTATVSQFHLYNRFWPKYKKLPTTSRRFGGRNLMACSATLRCWKNNWGNSEARSALVPMRRTHTMENPIIESSFLWFQLGTKHMSWNRCAVRFEAMHPFPACSATKPDLIAKPPGSHVLLTFPTATV